MTRNGVWKSGLDILIGFGAGVASGILDLPKRNGLALSNSHCSSNFWNTHVLTIDSCIQSIIIDITIANFDMFLNSQGQNL